MIGKRQAMVQIWRAACFWQWCFTAEQSHPFIYYCLQRHSCCNGRVKWFPKRLFGSPRLKYSLLKLPQRKVSWPCSMVMFPAHDDCLTFWIVHFIISTGTVLQPLNTLYLAPSWGQSCYLVNISDILSVLLSTTNFRKFKGCKFKFKWNLTLSENYLKV